MSASSNKTARRYVSLIFEPLWVIGAFFLAALMFALTLSITPGVRDSLETTVGQLLSGGIIYTLAVCFAVLPVYVIRKKDYVKKLLGVHKKPVLRALGFALLMFGAYMLTTMVVTGLSDLLPFVDLDEKQEVGFDGISHMYEYILVFFALVVLPPVAEELLFRGYLFGRLREHFGFWLTTLVVSTAFGFIHLQWNVGIDVAVLSVFLCYLREKTGTIWASMMLHGIKNGLAYFLLFIAPLLGWNLL